ncbi:hypothetical protein [Eubacterium sp.]
MSDNNNNDNKYSDDSSDNISTNNSNGNTSSNKHIAEIVTIALLAIVLIFFVVQCSRNKNESSTSGTIAASSSYSGTTVPPVVVQNENGDQTEIADSEINFRNISFASSMNEIKALESKSNDTLDNPDDSSSADGYTYLTYSFNGKNDPTAFGTVANVSDASASLVYVFKNDKLIEVRWQYGKLDASAYDSIIADASSQFGPATYSREYSNGYKESWWRTKDVLISFLYQDSGISIYYKTLK